MRALRRLNKKVNNKINNKKNNRVENKTNNKSKNKSNSKSKSSIRLAKFLAECGIASRRKSEELIEEGRVKVNDIVVLDVATNVDAFIDKVKFNNKVLELPSKGVVILHKPRSVITARATEAEERKVVSDLLPRKFENYFPVGRLDFESTGLVIMTNDGDLAQVLMHPRYNFIRVYEVKVKGKLTLADISKIRHGVKLDDGLVQARLEIIKEQANSTWIKIAVRIGKNRIIRRLMGELGYPVEKLKRVQHGPFKLGSLPARKYEELSYKQYSALREKIFDEVREKERLKKEYKDKQFAKIKRKVKEIRN